MNVVEKLRKVLRDRMGIYVPQEEITVESVQLYADEIDEKLVLPEMLKGLTEPIQADLASYRNEHGVEYLLIRIEIGKEAPLEILVIDDEVVGENVASVIKSSNRSSCASGNGLRG